MPAKSKSQQRFMGMVRQCQKSGDCASKSVSDAASSMSAKDASKFAKTKRKGLPDKVSENKITFMDYMMEGYRSDKYSSNKSANIMGAAANLNDDSERYREHYIKVPYSLRQEAKKYGAIWDPEAKSWYVIGPVPEPLKDILDAGVVAPNNSSSQKIYLQVPYKDKDEVKKYGARWDNNAKKWYYPGNNPPMELEKWRMN